MSLKGTTGPYRSNEKQKEQSMNKNAPESGPPQLGQNMFKINLIGAIDIGRRTLVGYIIGH